MADDLIDDMGDDDQYDYCYTCGHQLSEHERGGEDGQDFICKVEWLEAAADNRVEESKPHYDLNDLSHYKEDFLVIIIRWQAMKIERLQAKLGGK